MSLTIDRPKTAPKAVWPSGNSTRDGLIISAQDALRLKEDVLFLDVRAGADGDPAEYRKAHVPGAIYASVKEIFAGPASAAEGSLPLPRLDALQAHVAQWGISENTEIVVYGPHPAYVARAWWVLKWAGLPHVRLLDGGFDAWKDAGGIVQVGEAIARPPAGKPAVLSAGHLPSVEIADIETIAERGILLDARDPSAYTAGPAVSGQPPAGHIPGARNLPAALAWDQKGKLRSQHELVDLFGTVGVEPESEVTSSCGGGVLGAYEVLALNAIGVRAALYVGSWSQWSADPARPRAHGQAPR
jgi:thiosulfate/3-mercaptopyruvate sulfurtransferase